MVLTIISSALGIVSTLAAWFFNPRRRLYTELDSIYKQLEALYDKRDKALETHDSDALSISTADIIRLCNRKAALLQRLR